MTAIAHLPPPAENSTACARLIGREPKALRVAQSSKSRQIVARPRTKSGLSEKITQTSIKTHTRNRLPQSNFTNENFVD